MTGVKLNQVTLAVRNMSECVAFYERLGFTLIVDSIPRYARFELPGGETLSLHHEDDWSGSDWPLIYLETERLDAFCSELEASGHRLESQPTDQSWLWREADVRDPSGNRIRLYHAGDNRRFPPWRVKNDHPTQETA